MDELEDIEQLIAQRVSELHQRLEKGQQLIEEQPEGEEQLRMQILWDKLEWAYKLLWHCLFILRLEKPYWYGRDGITWTEKGESHT